jgi:hypothetical protein
MEEMICNGAFSVAALVEKNSELDFSEQSIESIFLMHGQSDLF